MLGATHRPLGTIDNQEVPSESLAWRECPVSSPQPTPLALCHMIPLHLDPRTSLHGRHHMIPLSFSTSGGETTLKQWVYPLLAQRLSWSMASEYAINRFELNLRPSSYLFSLLKVLKKPGDARHCAYEHEIRQASAYTPQVVTLLL